MALPRFLYSTSESIHEELLSGSDNEEPLGISPHSKGDDLTGALSKSRREVARSPGLPPSFVGNLSGSNDTAQLERERNRREREFDTAAVAMATELSEPAGANTDSSSSSDSSESGILETMGESRRGQKGNGGLTPDQERLIGINDGYASHRSAHASSHRSSATSSGTCKCIKSVS